MAGRAGSVTMSGSVAADCVRRWKLEENGATNRNENAQEKQKHETDERLMRSLLSRLAREVKVVRVSGIVSGLRGCGLRRSPGSAALRRAAFPSASERTLTGDSGSRGISSALQSRGGDGFAPSSRHGVCGGCVRSAAARLKPRSPPDTNSYCNETLRNLLQSNTVSASPRARAAT